MDTNARPGHGRERIHHVIVLMMENRSFDHLLGFLRPDDPQLVPLCMSSAHAATRRTPDARAGRSACRAGKLGIRFWCQDNAKRRQFDSVRWVGVHPGTYRPRLLHAMESLLAITSA
jgi:hypothetical protein